MDKILMVDLQTQYQRIKADVDAAIQQVLTSTSFIQGPEVGEFAMALATYTGAKYVVPCANGTDALQIAMMSLGFVPGDEVIIPVHTYVATAEVIALLGLTPVFIDVDQDTFNIDVRQLESKITDRTVAIVPVHLYGQCADMDSLQQIADSHGVSIIEDAAQSLGAEFIFQNGSKKQAGTIGKIGTTSFFPSKNLGCFGDGGALLTNDEALAEKIKMIANHGQKIKYHHDVIGVNSRLDTLQAAILLAKLRHFDDFLRRRHEVASYYDHHLSGIPQVELPFRAPFGRHVFNQYTLKIKEGRDDFKKYLMTRGIPSMIYYVKPLHYQPAYRKSGVGEGSFPVSEKLAKNVISLPIHTEMSTEQLAFICTTIKEYFSQ
jgi:dTDP-4-amino-4,6-dideoxygalactose transaminase